MMIGFEHQISLENTILEDDGAMPAGQKRLTILQVVVFEVSRAAIGKILRFLCDMVKMKNTV